MGRRVLTLEIVKEEAKLRGYKILSKEFDGRQHFEPVTFGGVSIERAKENLKSQKKRDKVKDRFCKNNNICLIRISYKEVEKIETILSKKLKLRKVS